MSNATKFQSGKHLFLILFIVLFSLQVFAVDNFAGNCLDFDGVDEYVQVNATVIPASGDFTVVVWVKADAGLTGFREILSQNAGTGGQNFYLGIADLTGNIRVGDQWGDTAIGFPTDNQWHYFTVTKNSSNTWLYVDGTLASTYGSAITNPAGSEFRIGRQYGSHSEYFPGLIEELSIWNVCLDSTQINNTMNSTLSGTETGLVSYWQFNESNGTIASDAVGTNDGTLHNMEDDDWVISTAPVGLPAVITTIATSITYESAISGGEVTFAGGYAVTARGVCWSETVNPTLSDPHTTDGTGEGVFTSLIDGLAPITDYYYRAYATNSLGTSYGNELTFSTTPQGSGTSGDPYQIATLTNLRWLSEHSGYWDFHFIQTADINASATSSWNGGEGFIPIGNNTTKFMGTYDGQEHTIDSLYINRPFIDYQSLFGRTNSSTIENLGVANADVSGSWFTGGLVGYNKYSSTISNCYSTGSVSGYVYVGGLVGYNENSTIGNCYSTGSVSGSYYIGGLVGYNYNSTISNCYSTGSVTGSSDTGGLVGDNENSTISNCYSTGSVSGYEIAGGLVGHNGNSTISNCYSTGSVSGSTYIGGLVGHYYSTISNSFWDIETSGQATSAGGIGKTTAEMQTESTFTDAGWDFAWETANGSNDYWGMVPSFMNGYPFLSWQPVFLAYYTTPIQEVFIGTEIQFTDNSFGSPTEWQWDFENDGTYDSTEQNPVYTYPTTGVYSVKLTVSDGINTDSYIRTDYIYVNNTPSIPQNVQVTVSGDDAIISWDAVTEDIDGVPINLDGYIVKFSENNIDFFYLQYTIELSHTHTYVTIHSPQMFYYVLAYKSYSTRELEYLKELNNSREKLKWSEVKRNLERIKNSPQRR